MKSLESSRNCHTDGEICISPTGVKDSKPERLNFLLVLMVLTNILFPKAGIKIGEDIPLTVGNIVVIFLIASQGIKMLARRKITFYIIDGTILIEIIYWIFRIGVVALNDPNMALSLFPVFVVFAAYPFVFWATKSLIRTTAQIEKILRLIRLCILLVMAYAVIQLFWGIGETAIPGLTVNYSDYIANPTNWWNTKNNAFVVGSKMVSTYQNGNILGVSLVFLYPMVYRIPTSKKIFKAMSFILFTIVIFLTGCRSAMFGYLFYVLLLIIAALKDSKVTLKTLSTGFFAAILMGVALVLLLGTEEIKPLTDRVLSSLSWDVILSGTGRTEKALDYFSWIFNNGNSNGLVAVIFGGLGFPHDGGAYEMTYVYIFLMGGILGLFLFMMPFVLEMRKCRKHVQSKDEWMKRGILEGILAYGFTAFMEGAYLLPPVAINLWFILAILERLIQASSITGTP